MEKPEFDPKLIFTSLQPSGPELNDIKVRFSDIEKLYRQSAPDTIWHPFTDTELKESYYYFIGFESRTNRFLLVALAYDVDEDSIYFLQVKVADVQEIREKWCPFQSLRRT